MDELQTGIQPALAVLPSSAAFLQPRKARLHHPALGHDLKPVQFTALGNLHSHMLAQDLAHALRKGLARIAR